MLPKDLARLVPKSHLMTENEWRAIGVQQSRGWVINLQNFQFSGSLLKKNPVYFKVHYMIHHPEPHILLFRRKLNK